MKDKGKLVVIEGTDGSGKNTQVELCFNKLNNQGISTKKIHYPRYDEFYGQLCARLLNGEFGDYKTVDPYFYTLMLAMDRWQAKPVVQSWLDEGNVVLSDRYVYSLAHQVARLPKEKQEEYITWFLEMEFKINGLPKEELVIFLYVPSEYSYEMVKKKQKRAYLNGNDTDIAEKDFEHQKNAEKVYLDFSKRFDNWKIIECISNNTLRSIEDINEEMIGILREEEFIS